MLEKNKIYRAAVSGFTSEGQGVCRVEGWAVFVPNAAPGEEYELRITHLGKHNAFGKIETIITKSPHRVNRLCPYGKLCGGCDFWHLDYAGELEIKRQRVLDNLNRLGGQALEQLPITGAKDFHSYRNKAQYPVAPGKKGVEAGFYKRGSHELIPVERCLIQPEIADLGKKAVLQWAREYRVPAYDEKTQEGLLRHIFVRWGEATGEVMICLVVNGKKLPREKELIAALREKIPGLRSLVLNINTRKGNAVLGEETRTLWGADAIEDVLCGLKFRISPRSFYQVNRKQAEVLYEKAIAAAELTGKETVLDLYCGTGTITLCLAKQAKQVIGVELVEAAIRDARENAARNGIENAAFFCADAGQAAQKFSEENIQPHVIVVDPPRKGLSGEVIDAVVKMAPEKLVYVSCDPATLARDVKLLGEKGYHLTYAEAVDMFPRCAHVESVVCLSREKADDYIRISVHTRDLQPKAN